LASGDFFVPIVGSLTISSVNWSGLISLSVVVTVRRHFPRAHGHVAFAYIAGAGFELGPVGGIAGWRYWRRHDGRRSEQQPNDNEPGSIS